jgi:hypothetical protein
LRGTTNYLVGIFNFSKISFLNGVILIA